MPVRSSSSSVLVWPDWESVGRALRDWAATQAARRQDLVCLGAFGSWARRNDWGVGSDLDLVAIVDHRALPFSERSLEWDLLALPVPAEVLVYTVAEWALLGGRFADRLAAEAVWLAGSPPSGG